MPHEARFGRPPVLNVLIIAVVIGLVGCASTNGGAEGPAPPVGEATATLVVENQSTAQMRIFALAAGQQVRIGTVNGLTTQTLQVPDYLIGGGRSVRFSAVPLAGRGGASTSDMYMSPGDSVRLIIPSQLR